MEKCLHPQKHKEHKEVMQIRVEIYECGLHKTPVYRWVGVALLVEPIVLVDVAVVVT